jgi:hypothetical protein
VRQGVEVRELLILRVIDEEIGKLNELGMAVLPE